MPLNAHMYVHLEQLFQGAYCCEKCERVVSLESEIADMKRQLAILRDIGNLERELELTEQALASTSGADGGAVSEEQVGSLVAVSEEQVGSWVTVRRGSRGNRERQVVSELTHPNRFAMLSEDIGNVGAEMSRLGETNSSSSQGNSSSSTVGTQDAQIQIQFLDKERQHVRNALDFNVLMTQ
ncbi:hypothetical protein FKM82_028639 [Ascaphus truei]